MSKEQNRTEQRRHKTLLFPMKFFREIIRSFKYIYRSLTMSMRKKIAFDYSVLYAIVSIMTLAMFSIGFTLYEVRDEAEQVMAEIYEAASTKDKGFYDVDELQRQLANLSEEASVGISIRMTSDNLTLEPYSLVIVETEKINEQIFDMSIPRLVNVLFTEGAMIRSEQRNFILDENKVASYEISIAQNLRHSSRELWFLILVLFIAQIVGLTIISFVSSYRLRRVFRPVYNMTRTAEKISINDMNAKLDVSKAEYELKDLALTFNDMLDRIRTDYDKQKRFVSDVSHELRTPISIVNGYARMLDRWGKEDEAILEEAIDAIKGESKNMQTLVENLLTLVRSDNQTLKFEREYFMMDTMAGEIIRDMEMIDDGRHSFSHHIEKDIEVCLDYAKVKQTLRIFLDNAIKYTPSGGHISLTLKKEDKEVIVSVNDTGIGVAKKDLPYLFDRFYRSDESRTRETGGHGLGLSIARAMVIGQKGRLRVKSKEDEGSEFIIILPLSYGEEG